MATAAAATLLALLAATPAAVEGAAVEYGARGSVTLATDKAVAAASLGNRYVLVLTMEPSVHVLDVADVAHPVAVGSVSLPVDSAFDITVGDRPYAFIAAGVDGVLVLNITDPARLSIAGHYQSEGQGFFCTRVAVEAAAEGYFSVTAVNTLRGLVRLNVTDVQHIDLAGGDRGNYVLYSSKAGAAVAEVDHMGDKDLCQVGWGEGGSPCLPLKGRALHGLCGDGHGAIAVGSADGGLEFFAQQANALLRRTHLKDAPVGAMRCIGKLGALVLTYVAYPAPREDAGDLAFAAYNATGALTAIGTTPSDEPFARVQGRDILALDGDRVIVAVYADGAVVYTTDAQENDHGIVVVICVCAVLVAFGIFVFVRRRKLKQQDPQGVSAPCPPPAASQRAVPRISSTITYGTGEVVTVTRLVSQMSSEGPTPPQPP
eukprot:TRINITY_DN814_c0_g5_i1.p1 TRINITY_DN814_c0_g5~~TRINITY_DN814_c0_g5_i1.p1  ORF type:complete len:453 (+),score=88.40 TRINITY_DN814_c0_g5_i1:68-1360(+)